MRNCVVTFVLALVAATVFSSALSAQTAQGPGSAKPAAASAPAPAHDLSGVWNMHSTPAQRKFTGNTYTAEPPGMTPWATEKYNGEKPSNGPRTHSLKETDDPVLKECLPPGTPRIYLQPFPFQIVQSSKYILIAYEFDNATRTIYMGNAPPSPVDTWMGRSVGHWEGDTLVVDVTSFNDQTWFDRAGNFHSDALHVVERYTPLSPDAIMYEATIEDPAVFTRPWKMSMPLYRRLEKNAQLLEFKCVEFVEELMYGPLRKKPAK